MNVFLKDRDQQNMMRCRCGRSKFEFTANIWDISLYLARLALASLCETSPTFASFLSWTNLVFLSRALQKHTRKNSKKRTWFMDRRKNFPTSSGAVRICVKSKEFVDRLLDSIFRIILRTPFILFPFSYYSIQPPSHTHHAQPTPTHTHAHT